jgi:hypothetical protein
MTPAGDDRFTSTIQVAREDVQYRVRAGDALTKKYLLRSLARPAVVQFDKTYTFPAYAKMEPKRVTEEHGDLAALEGSEVELRLAVNQKVKAAELRIEQGRKGSETVPLTPDGEQFVAKVPLKAPGIYRVHLVSAESGFENKFSPEYELRAEPDLVPEVAIDEPAQDLILPANEIVDLRGTASDDQALARVVQLVKVNDGPWRETVLATDPGQRTTVERRWDLFESGAKAGDLLATKLVAFDRKGSRAESLPVQISITASGFETKRLLTLEAERQLHALLRELRTVGDAFEKAAIDAREQFERLPDGDEARKQVVVGAVAKVEEFQQKSAAVWTQLITTLKDAPAGHDGAELVTLARQLAKIDGGGVAFARAALEVLDGDSSSPTAREQMREAVENCVRSTQRVRVAEDCYRRILACNEVDVLAENLQVVSKEQERLVELANNSGDDAKRWSQLADRMRVVLAETKSLEEIMRPLAERAEHGDLRNRLSKLQKKLEEQRTNLVKTMSVRGAGKDLLEPTRALSRTLEDSAKQLLDSRRGIAKLGADALRTMHSDAGPTYALLEMLRGESEALARNNRLPDAARARLLDARFETRAGWLKAIGDAEETRVNSDSYYVSDLRQMTLSLPTLRAAVAAGPVEQWGARLLAFDRSFRVLESGHNLAEVLDGLRVLSDAERWELVAARGRTSNPRNWEWLEARLKEIPNEFSRANLDGEVRKVMDAARKIVSEVDRLSGFRAVAKEMDQRDRLERLPERQTVELDEVAAKVKEALELLRQPMEQARQEIAALTPKLHEMMQQLAKQTQQIKQETQEQAAKTEEKKPEEAQADAKQQLAKQERLNEKVDDLKDAIRAEANKQNVMEAEGRERARDADDALAMLKEPPKKAAEALAEATKSEAPQVQKQALTDAAMQQQKLADSLQQLAQHYENVEKGQAQDSRMALRETEKENGIKQELDEQYQKAAELAEMSKKTPQEMLAQLEKALPKNPLMQHELSAIAKNSLTEAQQQLEQASKQETAVADTVQKVAAAQAQQPQQQPAPSQQQPAAPNQPNPSSPSQPNPAAQPSPPNSPPSPTQPQPGQPQSAPMQNPPSPPNPQLAQAAKKQPQIAESAMQAGDQVERAGRHEERLSNPMAGEQLQKLGSEIQKTAQQSVPQAQQALEKAQMASEAQPAVKAADGQLKEQLSQLGLATLPGLPIPGVKPSPAQPAAPSPMTQAQSGQKPPTPGEKAQTSPNAQTPSGQPESPSPAQQNAQASASQAAPAPHPPMTPPGQQPGAPTAQAQMPGQPGAEPPPPTSMIDRLTEPNAAPPTPQEQLWMARTLDALDQALNASTGQQQGEQGRQGQPKPGQPQQGQQPRQPGQQAGQQQQGGQQQPQQAMSPAQQALAAAQQAAAAAMRASRNESPSEKEGGDVAQSEMQAVSRGGAKVDAGNNPYGAMPDANGLRGGDWGKLPKRIAEQMTQGAREAVAGEYRGQVETYYRVIAEKAKAP